MDTMELDETESSLDGTLVADVASFTADIQLETVYWVDSASSKMWSSKLTDNDHSLVSCLCH